MSDPEGFTVSVSAFVAVPDALSVTITVIELEPAVVGVAVPQGRDSLEVALAPTVVVVTAGVTATVPAALLEAKLMSPAYAAARATVPTGSPVEEIEQSRAEIERSADGRKIEIECERITIEW